MRRWQADHPSRHASAGAGRPHLPEISRLLPSSAGNASWVLRPRNVSGHGVSASILRASLMTAHVRSRCFSSNPLALLERRLMRKAGDTGALPDDAGGSATVSQPPTPTGQAVAGDGP